MILVDTSVWIDYFANKALPHVDRLGGLLQGEDDVCICDPIFMEVLQGIRDDTAFEKTLQYLESLVRLPLSRDAYVRSAEIYRALRKREIRVRGKFHCLVAAVAIGNDVALLHNDRDFAVIAEHFPLRTAV